MKPVCFLQLLVFTDSRRKISLIFSPTAPILPGNAIEEVTFSCQTSGVSSCVTDKKNVSKV